MIADQLISSHIVTLKPDDTCAFALARMEELHLAHLPIVHGSEFAGLVSDLDLISEDPESEISRVKMAMPGISILPGRHAYEALGMFTTRQLTTLPVVNEKNLYMGSVILSDLVNALSGMTGIAEPGGIILLEMNVKDYSLAGIAQVIESNDAMVLSAFVSTFSDSTRLEVTLKVNRMEIGPLLQAFNRLNYNVKASWSTENAYNDGLRERFDALMNYLSI